MQDTTMQIVDTPHGKMLLGKYKDDECSIKILLYDFENYGQFIFYPFDNVVYIHDFECRDQSNRKGTGRGRGRKLLFTVLNRIREIKGKNTSVTLTASSKNWASGGNDAELIKYYNRLGFREIDQTLPGLMSANIETVMRNCSPEEFQPLPEPSPNPATAAAAAAPLEREIVQPAAEAYFSSSEESNFFPYSPSQSESQSSESFQPGSVPSTSVEPNRFGGKKNHTNRKYTMKTRKNKKSKKRWSLKYKKSINCKRPRGFSQRQYCKYGRKNLK